MYFTKKHYHMEFFHQLQKISIAFYAFLFAIIFFYVVTTTKRKNKNQTKRKPPKADGEWPLIGHLHLFLKKPIQGQLLHHTLGSMADIYGPAFVIRLGSHQTLVVSDSELVKQCFTTNDKAFSTRPRTLAFELMSYNFTMPGLAPYGSYWRDIRKLIKTELLSNNRLDSLKHIRDAETKCFIEELYMLSVKNGGLAIVEMNEKFGDLALNVIVQIVAGKRYVGTDDNPNDESRSCQKALRDFFYFLGLYLVTDSFPFLGWLDAAMGYVGKMRKTMKELDRVFERWLHEHQQKRQLGGVIDEKGKDFIDVMLSIVEDGKIFGKDANTVIKATCLNLIAGGNDTTVRTLTWAISLLLNNPYVLKKAQDELNIHVGQHRQVDESDVKNLVYLQAIVKETLRLHPPGPLSASREAVEDCVVDGFHISAGTRLLVNMWKLHRDPRVWLNPSEFIPERFLNENVDLDVKGLDFELVPFGSGRRKCPGISFGLQVQHLTLARMIHSFELGTVSSKPVDMSEGPGLFVPKATPLEVTLTPRLPSSLY